MGTDTNALLGVPEAAAIAGTCQMTIRRWLEADVLPGTRVGERWLLLRHDLMAYLVERDARHRATRYARTPAARRAQYAIDKRTTAEGVPA